MEYKTEKKEKGFTLIELIVVMAIFLFVIGAAIAIFISIIQQQKRVLSEQELLNQVSYVEEYMSKALRMARKDTNEGTENPCVEQGYIYLLTRPENGFYRGIKFINQSNDICQEFFLDNATDPVHPVLKELKDSTNDSDAVAITSSNLEISFIRFGINGTDGCYGAGSDCPDGASEADSVQPKVTILLGIKIQGDSQNPARVIQTTVSQRNLNLKQ
jgi:type II secretory pathway pseudopilin PulG